MVINKRLKSEKMLYIFLVIYGLILGPSRAHPAGEESTNSGENNTDIKLMINGTHDNTGSPVENQAEAKISYDIDEDALLYQIFNGDLTNGTVVSSMVQEPINVTDATGYRMQGTINDTNSDAENITSNNEEMLNNTTGNELQRDKPASTTQTVACQLLSVLIGFGIDVPNTSAITCSNINVSAEKISTESTTDCNTLADRLVEILSSESKNVTNNSNDTATTNSSNTAKDIDETDGLDLNTFIGLYVQELLNCALSNVDTAKLLDLPNGIIGILQLGIE